MKPLLKFVRIPMVAALLTVAAAGCGNVGLPSTDAPTERVNPAIGYRLEPGNIVRVTVFNESNLSGDFQVDPAGNVGLPLIGNVPAAGISADTLAERIGATLQRGGFLREPRVNVEVVTYRPFYVLGEVRNPGEFPYVQGMTVLSAIAKAGGYDFRARQGEVALVRIEGGVQKEYRATEQTPILPGDIIRVVQRYF